MTSLMNRVGKAQLVFPIDIDEFIVYYDKNNNKISVDSKIINEYVQKLPVFPVFSMNYINPKITTPEGCSRAVKQCKYGSYQNYGRVAKKFFNTTIFNDIIDHGNHYQTHEFILSDLCLIHYHCRNLEQMKKKVYNNVIGLGYHPFNIYQLKMLLRKNPSCPGHHHVINQINILMKKYTIPCELVDVDNDIDISVISTKISN